ncbi:T9SS type A sorting domain-containing protein [Chryseobacterium foetidum]|uniref:T9SS type A sorting domain-containing protein n=1 Tax=Chryseobacterium foetidum TaxID=2951057 RepID=UPI0021C7FFE5|nr:T9SS type A sorting domain-containing protein [Chryseobacterium foetidum]
MKTKLLSVAGVVLSSILVNSLNAQEYQPISLSGFNADVIANGVGTSATSTNNDVDGVSYNFISRDFQLTATSTPLTYGLPTNGIISTAVASTSGLQYQLAPYSSNNSLRLETAGTSGTLTLSTPVAALSLYMLATGGSGACTVDVTVNFSDNTTQVFAGQSISDWYGGTNYAIQGIGRINRNNDNLESGGGTNPRLYQIPMAISAANQSKLIQSITVTKTGTGGIPNIFAFSGDLYTSCPAPTNFTSTTTMNSATVNWTAPTTAPTAGYQYYLTTSSTPPTATTTPSGSVAAGTTTLNLPGLQTGQTYNLWIRSNCGASLGFWKMTSFTTGQISVTYSAGDINTEFNSSVSATSTTNCPGTMSVTIPAGYKINSTSVSYNMTTADNGWMSEQRSILVCSTNGNTESAISSGSGSNAGTFSYNRTGLALANDLTGTVNFELRAWRTYGGSACSATHNKVDNNTWKVTVTLEALPQLATAETQNKTKEISAYPNPFQDVLNIKNHGDIRKITITDFSGINLKTIEKPSATIQLSDLKSGVYILTSIMNDGSVKSMKIIKK